MMYNTGLYIRRSGSQEPWQEFLGGYTKVEPALLYNAWEVSFKWLHGDYERVVLERRQAPGKGNRNAMYLVGQDREVEVKVDRENPFDWGKRKLSTRDVKCLSSWHVGGKEFKGSAFNRICPECVEKEQDWQSGKELEIWER